MPRAASCSACSGVGAGIVWVKKRDVGGPLPEQQRLVHRHRAARQHADGPVADLPAVAVRAVQHVAAPPLPQPRHVRELVDQAGGHQQPAGPQPVGRRPASTANRSPSRSAAVDLAVHDSPPYAATSARPRASSSPGGVPSRPSSPCTPAAGALRGAPGVDHHHRPPRPGQHQRCVQPRRSAADHHDVGLSVHSVIATTSTTTMRRIAAIRQTSLPMWQTWACVDGDLDEAITAAGPRLRALRRQRDTTLAELSRGDRHLGEHAVAAGVGAAAARRSSCCCRWPGPTASPSTSWSAPRPPATRASTCARSTRGGMTMLPLTRRAGGIQAYKMVIPAGGRPAEPDLQDPRGLRVGLRPQRAAAPASSASTTSCCGRGRRPSSTCRTPHWFGPAVGDSVEFLSLFGKQGERAHLRAAPKSTTRA